MDGVATLNPLGAADSEFLGLQTVVEALLSRVHTASLVRVVSCTNAGGVAQVGYVDLQIIVQQRTAAGLGVPHATIHDVPYSRMQGGANAIICDPVAGDIGIAIFAERDITASAVNASDAVPATPRTFAYADAMYLGGVRNAAPTQYIQFTPTGINIVSPQAVSITAPSINAVASTGFNVTSPLAQFSAAVTIQGLLTWAGGMVGSITSGTAATITGAVNFIGALMSNGKNISSTHTHTGVQTGTGTSGEVS